MISPPVRNSALRRCGRVVYKMAACRALLRRTCNSKLFSFRSVVLSPFRGLSAEPRAEQQESRDQDGEVSEKTLHEQTSDLVSNHLSRNKDKNFTTLMNYRYMYPEFLPDSNPMYRNAVRERLERMDMLKRRRVLEIPEFYVGSILAVTASDEFAPGKSNRFVGICILRAEHGMRTNFTLRNVVDHQGVEITYDLYNPCIIKIEVLKLEKRLDDHLLYLRDADPEVSTFPFDLEATHHPENTPVPVNRTKVKLRPPPWFARWEQWNLEGVDVSDIQLPEWKLINKEKNDRPWNKWDLMKEYRQRIHEEDQMEIWKEVDVHHKEVKTLRKTDRRKSLQQKSFLNSSHYKH